MSDRGVARLIACGAVVVCGAGAGCGDQLQGPARDAAIDGAPGVPDLAIHVDRAKIDLAVGSRDFAADACELDPDEDCVVGPGTRQLLWFSVETPNIGTADVVLGQPSSENPEFVFSECHDHFHFEGYADYELLTADGAQVAVGHKQAFCLVDSNRFVDEPGVPAGRRYSCRFQGIQAGWSDVYSSRLPCQFLDVTDIAPGPYVLRVDINRARAIDELDHDNNTVEIALDLTDPALHTPTETCEAGLDPRAAESANRECGWQSAMTAACTPGSLLRIGCNQHCGDFALGRCTGDPMLRVCDATRADGNCTHPSAIAAGDDACQSSCPFESDIACPASGQVEIFVAPKVPGDPVDCTLGVVEG